MLREMHAFSSRLTLGTTPIKRKAGLNNQRMALLGLCLQADSLGAAVTLPDKLVDLNSLNYGLSGLVDIFSVFDRELVQAFLADHDFADATQNVQLTSWEDCFSQGVQVLSAPDEDRIIPAFLRAFQASVPIRHLADRIWERLDRDIVTLQLRVEADWQRHVTRKEAAGFPAIFLRKPEDILRKVKATPALGLLKHVYVCADIAGLSDEEGIKDMARRDFGMELLFKHDLLAGADLPTSPMMSAALDFEVARRSRQHVGPMRSTFFVILKRTAEAIGDRPVRRFHAYDEEADYVVEV